ncbi:MAG: NAD(P)-dependent oxidoreductase [Armatimonadetes bacterium]|nr:NAD(P)-dependent oxidoreductase [Armatimonadota bacterium]
MKKVLVTGAAGFIGRHSLPFLSSLGYEIHAVTSRQNATPEGEAHWHVTDLLDPHQVDALFAEVQPTHLLHLAWYTAHGKYWTSPENLKWAQAGIQLFRSFVQNGGRRVVSAGTCAEYDWRYGYCSEGVTPLAPATLYGTCKHALEHILASASLAHNVSMAWGRVFFLFGPHEPPGRLVPSVIRSLLAGDPALSSHGGQIRDFLHVRDVAEAFVSLLESEVTGPVNIASGKPVTLREVIHKIADRLCRPDLVRLGSLPARPDDPDLLLADVRRLTREVGWMPRHTLDEGLEETIAWWREVGNGHIGAET